MNKNTKRRHAENRKAGNVGFAGFKKKAKPFPQPKDAGLSLHAQREMLPNYK